MTRDQIRQTVLTALGRVAPEVDPAALDPAAPLRDQIDIDSMDFLNFLVALHKELGVDIPEKDYPRLATLDGCVTYLTAATTAHP
jgi:acyl carrier protein